MGLVWAFGPDDRTETIVLLAIADHAHDNGKSAWPSMPSIARKARCDERTARRVVRRLEETGYLRTVTGGIRNGDQRIPNHYEIVLSTLVSRGGVMPPLSDMGEIRGGTVPPDGGQDEQIRGGVVPPKPSLEPSLVDGQSSGEKTVRADTPVRSWIKTLIPDNWNPPDETLAHLRKTCPDVNIDLAHQKFMAFHRGQPSRTSADWPSTFEVWCLGDQDKFEQYTKRDLKGRTNEMGFPLSAEAAWDKHLS